MAGHIEAALSSDRGKLKQVDRRRLAGTPPHPPARPPNPTRAEAHHSCSQLSSTDLISTECSCSVNRLLRYVLKQHSRSCLVLSECHRRFSGIFRLISEAFSVLPPQANSQSLSHGSKLWWGLRVLTADVADLRARRSAARAPSTAARHYAAARILSNDAEWFESQPHRHRPTDRRPGR